MGQSGEGEENISEQLASGIFVDIVRAVYCAKHSLRKKPSAGGRGGTKGPIKITYVSIWLTT